jgi:hypothetical protein
LHCSEAALNNTLNIFFLLLRFGIRNFNSGDASPVVDNLQAVFNIVGYFNIYTRHLAPAMKVRGLAMYKNNKDLGEPCSYIKDKMAVLSLKLKCA